VRVPHFDLIIIGSGSGNSLVTPDFADWQIAIVEAGTFGGTCLNVGCIPTKMYVYAADVAEAIRGASRYGIDGRVDGVRWADLRDRVFRRIDAISAGGREYRAYGEGVTLYESEASFSGPNSLVLGTGEQITGDRIVVAAGSRPRIPDVITESGVPFSTSDDVMRLPELPRRLVILGGGYIAAEFAHVFGALGVEVSVVARSATLLRHLDHDIAERFTHLARRHWDVHLEVELLSATKDADGIHVRLSDGTLIDTDVLLVATGRVPNTDRLNPAAAGLDLFADGRLAVDAHQRTNVEGIWALGDVSSPFQLKHVANHEARVVAHNLAHPDDLRSTDHRFVPSAVFTHPQIASAGITEEQARESALDYVSSIQDFGGTAYGWAMEDTTSFCKLIADRITGQLLGAHLIGPQSSNLIQPLVQAMSFGTSARGLARGQYWIHPALSEVVENALLNLKLG
jgi:mycothione reductase